MRRIAVQISSVFVAMLILAGSAFPALALSEKAVSALKAGGHVILMRHARTVSGFADPPGFRLGDCATQRNLSDAGRADARALGDELRRAGISIGRVLSSPWCRCIDTAKLMLPDMEPEENANLGSFVAIRDTDTQRDALDRLRSTIEAWRGPGNLLMVSHQMTISALAGMSLAQGAMLIVKPKTGGFDVISEETP